MGNNCGRGRAKGPRLLHPFRNRKWELVPDNRVRGDFPGRRRVQKGRCARRYPKNSKIWSAIENADGGSYFGAVDSLGGAALWRRLIDEIRLY